MKNNILFILVTIFTSTKTFGHCQVPCGIYDDASRIVQIKEHFITIKKAMLKIDELSLKDDALSSNQLSRWVQTKEDHSSIIQRLVSDYFLTQRIKETHPYYLEQITLLQRLLVVAMNCKQTLENKNVEKGIDLLNLFSNSYFDSKGLEHLKNLMTK